MRSALDEQLDDATGSSRFAGLQAVITNCAVSRLMLAIVSREGREHLMMQPAYALVVHSTSSSCYWTIGGWCPVESVFGSVLLTVVA